MPHCTVMYRPFVLYNTCYAFNALAMYAVVSLLSKYCTVLAVYTAQDIVRLYCTMLSLCAVQHLVKLSCTVVY
jgi:hypothetical protein